VRLSWQKQETDQIAEPIHQRRDLDCQADARTPDGLNLSSSFAPVAF